MSKRDRQSVRTPADLERKYDFEKRFVLNDELDQNEVFNRLTNYGKSQGVFKGEDGNLYINASYLVTGILRSQDNDTFFLDLDNGILKGKFAEFSISGKSVEDTAQDVLDSQTQEDAFNKLTNGGEAQGIYYQNGELYINAAYITGAAPANILESVYPVGAVYISTVATNPKTLFGFGTWEQIQDRFLLAAGSTYAAGATGGEATHTLTVNEMPSHNHGSKTLTGTFGPVLFDDGLTISADGITSLSWARDRSWSGEAGSASKRVTINATHTHDSNGGGAAHNNMPPYLAVHVWKRTA